MILAITDKQNQTRTEDGKLAFLATLRAESSEDLIGNSGMEGMADDEVLLSGSFGICPQGVFMLGADGLTWNPLAAFGSVE